MAKKTVKIKLVKSPWGRLPKHRACIAGLGLRRVGSVSELEDTPAVRGMIDKVAYLLEVENGQRENPDPKGEKRPDVEDLTQVTTLPDHEEDE